MERELTNVTLLSEPNDILDDAVYALLKILAYVLYTKFQYAKNTKPKNA